MTNAQDQSNQEVSQALQQAREALDRVEQALKNEQ